MSDEEMQAATERVLDTREYVAPAIEDVISPETLGREVQYAGFSSPRPQ